jgi:proline iminopeptidase
MAEMYTVSNEGYVPVTGGKVWYQVVGEETGNPPLFTMHGGPGGTHNLMESYLGELSRDRQVVFYNQLGSEGSPPDDPSDLSYCNEDRFVEEFTQLTADLQLGPYHLLGHSWGGYLALRVALEHPENLLTVIASSPLVSVPRWIEDAERLKEAFPQDVQDAINNNEAAGMTDSEDYKAATKAFYWEHLCRIKPWPEDVLASFQKTNKVVYETMWGPSEFSCSGNLKGRDLTPRLGEIEIPVLFLGGRYDEARPESNRFYAGLIKGSETVVFEGSSHLSFIEESANYIQVVRDFMLRNDPS